MRENKFYITLSAIVLILYLVLYLMHQLKQFSPYFLISMTSLGVFTAFNIIVYNLAKVYSKQSSDKKYLGLIYMNFLAKLILVLIITVVFYFYYKKPPGFFVLPFILIYIVFTTFETWVLNKMAIMRK